MEFSMDVSTTRLGAFVAGAFYLAVATSLVAVAWKAVGMGQLTAAANIADLASGFATLFLVLLTGIYAYSTWRLVEETQQDRQHREALREKEMKGSRNRLHKVLIHEIGYINEWAEGRIEREEYDSGHPGFNISVFDNMTDKLGTLTEDELIAVVNFYNNVATLEEMIRFRARNPEREEGLYINQLKLVKSNADDALEEIRAKVD